MAIPDVSSFEPDIPPPRLTDGKDELNLAEFPLCAIADRLQPGQKTMAFEDRIWDESRGEMITRQLTITASDQHGLPTALDDEVILGLIQLCKIQGFTDRKVNFTRYQLIRLLGWRDEGKNYERLEKSLNRWVGVTLYYKNAWWSKEEQCWVNEKFHILDNVTLYDRDSAKRNPRTQSQSALPLSSFMWNDVIFRSFKAGNLKSLDFDFFKKLESAVAKRLYRFLDKRFFFRPRWEFNLKEFAWEHIGLARSYDVANLKRKLKPGIEELQHFGFLVPMTDDERFKKVSCGDWRIIFARAKAKGQRTVQRMPQQSEGMALAKALVERGVTPSTAEEVASKYPLDRIRTHLEVFDWLRANSDHTSSKNPAGFLISSIKSDYAPPKGFVSREERARRDAKAAERKCRHEERKRIFDTQQQVRENARERELEHFWQSLSAEERMRLEQEAIDEAGPFQRDLAQQNGALASAARKSILDAYALKMMKLGG